MSVTKSKTIRFPVDLLERLQQERNKCRNMSFTEIVVEKLKRETSMEQMAVKLAEQFQNIHNQNSKWSAQKIIRLSNSHKDLRRDISDLKNELALMRDVVLELSAFLEKHMDEPRGLSKKLKGLFASSNICGQAKKRNTNLK
ncbi:MAG: hypothetical protein ACOC4J_06220 [Bacteroidota bacterium]